MLKDKTYYASHCTCPQMPFKPYLQKSTYEGMQLHWNLEFAY